MYFFSRTFNNWRYLPYAWIIIFSITYNVIFGYHIILDPAGDSKDSGRILATCYERSITLQLCEALKEKIITICPEYTVTITHTVGESLHQEQRAQIANKSDAALFIHISCFEDVSIKPHIMIYYYMHNNTCVAPQIPYQLIPAHTAHLLSFPVTEKIANTLYAQLHKESTIHTVLPPCAIPDARLKQIQIPSCTIEIGTSHIFPWTLCIDPLCIALITSLKSLHEV